MTLKDDLQEFLETDFGSELGHSLVDEYFSLKQNHDLCIWRLSELESGRFCEIAIRCCEYVCRHEFTELNSSVKFDKIVNKVQNTPIGTAHDSHRLLIPQILQVIYRIRNSRNVSHFSDDLDPSHMDSEYLVNCCDWVIAEFVRVSQKIPASEAINLVKKITTNMLPVLEEIQGEVVVLAHALSLKDKILVLVNYADDAGFEAKQIIESLPREKGTSLRSAKSRLLNEIMIIETKGRLFITQLGKQRIRDIIRKSDLNP